MTTEERGVNEQSERFRFREQHWQKYEALVSKSRRPSHSKRGREQERPDTPLTIDTPETEHAYTNSYALVP